METQLDLVTLDLSPRPHEEERPLAVLAVHPELVVAGTLSREQEEALLRTLERRRDERARRSVGRE